jgi:SAM-dependent methyltransferase
METDQRVASLLPTTIPGVSDAYAEVESTENADDAPERFEPATMHGEMIEAEHLVRYAWACQFVAGARVLDAGCGLAYGSIMLADAGAAEVVGVDNDESVVASVRDGMPATVSLEVGDVTGLSHDEASFDIVVCFEVIEHVPEPERVLDELHRVLRPGGLLVVSTPNRDVYTPGNPYHLRELTPHELQAALSERFRSVRLFRQHTWIASGIVDDEAFAAADHRVLDGVELRKIVPNEPGRETYSIGVASDSALAAAHGSLSLTDDAELRRWSEMWHEQRQAIEKRDDDAAEREALLAALRGELDQVRSQLFEGEFRLSRIAELEARAGTLEELLPELDRLTRMERDYETVLGSHSWRLSKPLRHAATLLRNRST